MIEYRKKAEDIIGKITHEEERLDAWIFYNDDMKYDGAVVILKKNGKILSMTEYIIGREKVEK